MFCFAATFDGMATPITVGIPHQLGRAEAHRRFESGFAKDRLQKAGPLLLTKA